MRLEPTNYECLLLLALLLVQGEYEKAFTLRTWMRSSGYRVTNVNTDDDENFWYT